MGTKLQQCHDPWLRLLSRLHLAAARGFLLPLLAPQPFHPSPPLLSPLLCSSKGIVSAPMPLPLILSFAPDEEKPASQSVCGAVAHTQGKKYRCEVAWIPRLITYVPFRSLLIFHTKAPRHTNKFGTKQMSEQTWAISTHQKQMPPSAALPFPSFLLSLMGEIMATFHLYHLIPFITFDRPRPVP